MATRSTKRPWTWNRFSEGVFDRLGARPLGVIVFLLSALGLIWVTQTSFGKFTVPAVANAPHVDHPAQTPSFVEEVHVQAGDRVQAGAPLVTLSAELLERQLSLVDAEIQRVRRQAEMDAAQLAIDHADDHWGYQVDLERVRSWYEEAEAQEEYSDELADLTEDYLDQVRSRVERRVSQTDDLELAQLERARAEAQAHQDDRLLRARQNQVDRLDQMAGDLPELTQVMDSWSHYYEAELEALVLQRQAVLEDLQALTVYARTDGRVVIVLPQGAAVAYGTSVATIVPEHPTEIVAYLDPSQPPEVVQPGMEVNIVSDTTECPEPAQVVRRGATVEQAPGQLNDILNRPIWGWPVHISLPESCPLGVGQKVSVEFAAVHR